MKKRTKYVKKKIQKVRPTSVLNDLRKEFYDYVDEGKGDIREIIRRFRISLGMTQRQFAEYADVPARSLMAFEQGTGNPTLKTLEKMLKGSGLKMTICRKS